MIRNWDFHQCNIILLSKLGYTCWKIQVNPWTQPSQEDIERENRNLQTPSGFDLGLEISHSTILRYGIILLSQACVEESDLPASHPLHTSMRNVLPSLAKSTCFTGLLVHSFPVYHCVASFCRIITPWSHNISKFILMYLYLLENNQNDTTWRSKKLKVKEKTMWYKYYID